MLDKEYDVHILRPRLAQTEEIGERGKLCIELTILFGQLTLCLVSRAKMTSHPAKSLFGRTGIDNRGSLGASEPLHRARRKSLPLSMAIAMTIIYNFTENLALVDILNCQYLFCQAIQTLDQVSERLCDRFRKLFSSRNF